MSHLSNLNALHSSISQETSKLVKWEVETSVNMKDREGKIQLTSGITSTQEQTILTLEQENIKLRGDLGVARHNKEELQQRMSHTTKEVEVLTTKYTELHVEIEKLREDFHDPADSWGTELSDLISSVRSMSLCAVSSREEADKALKRIHDTQREEEAMNFEVMNNLELRINRMRQDVEQREVMVNGLESNLQQVSEYADRKQKDLDDATKSLHEENARKITFDEDILKLEKEMADNEVQFESMIEVMGCKVTEKNEGLKSMETAVLKQEEYLEKLQDEIESKRVEVIALETLSCQLDDENSLLEEKTRNIMEEVNSLAISIEEEDKVETDLDMLRADLRICEENRKMLESEIIAMRRVEHQMIGLEKENKNIRSRADLLLEKEASYNEDIALCHKQSEELEAKEKDVIQRLKALENENLDRDQQMKLLEEMSEKATEETKLMEANSLLVNEKINGTKVALDNVKNQQQCLQNEEVVLAKELSVIKSRIDELLSVIKSTELENNTKLNDLDILKGKGLEETSKLALQRTALVKLHETKHILESKMEGFKVEEETVYKAKEAQEMVVHEAHSEIKVLKEKIQALEAEDHLNEKSRLCTVLTAMKADLELQRSQVDGKDADLYKEVDAATKKYEACQTELELVKRQTDEILLAEEEYLKKLDILDIEINTKKKELMEKAQREEKLGKEITSLTSDTKQIEKDTLAVSKNIEIKYQKLDETKKRIDELEEKLQEYERKQGEILNELEELNLKKEVDLEEYRATLDQKVIDYGKVLEGLEVKKGELKREIEDIESQFEKLDIELKTIKAKKQMEMFKDFNEKKALMMKEKIALDVALSKCREEFELQMNIASNLQTEIEKFGAVGDDVAIVSQNRAGENVELIEVDSDEENVATRKLVSRSRSVTPCRNKSLLSVPSSTSNKRKLEESVKKPDEKSNIDVFEFGDSTDSEGQSQPKFLVPSTPRGRNIFSKNNFTPASKSQLILTKPRSVSYTPPTPRTLTRPYVGPWSAKHGSKKAKKGKEVKEAPSMNFDDVMALSSDVDSS